MQTKSGKRRTLLNISRPSSIMAISSFSTKKAMETEAMAECAIILTAHAAKATKLSETS